MKGNHSWGQVILTISVALIGLGCGVYAQSARQSVDIVAARAVGDVTLTAMEQARAEILALRIQLAKTEQALAATGAKLQVCEGAINQAATADAVNKLVGLMAEQKAFESSVQVPDGYEFDWSVSPPALKKKTVDGKR